VSFFCKFYEILSGCRLLLCFSVFFGFLFACTNLIPPLLIRELIQSLTEEIEQESRIGTYGITFSLLGIYLIRGFSRYSYGRYSHIAAYTVLHLLMVRTYRHIQRLPHSFFAEERTGNLISRSVNDVESIEDFVAHGIPETVLSFLIPSLMMVVLFLLDTRLALITLLPIPVVGILVYRYVRQVRIIWHDVRSRLSNLVSQIADNLSGISVIKSFVQEKSAASGVEKYSKTFRDASIQANKISLIPAGIVEASGGIGIVLVVWFGGGSALKGHISVADLFVFIVYLGHIYQPFLHLASINDVLQKASASAHRIFKLLALKPDIDDAPNACIPSGEFQWTVKFRDVSFFYNKGIPVLDGINFDINEGQIVALVGHTGAGKSTVSNLLPRYYDPTKGKVLLGGHDIRTLPLNFVRSNISSVEQDVFLFHGSVYDNIIFGRPMANRLDVERAAKNANAHEFIRNLDDGYDTLIGERGIRLSGGEKQRISIARSLLKNAPILIFDEATSSVDSETESIIQEAISRLLKDKTTLIISHRLSTVRNADRLIVLENGRIVETGTHDQLLSQRGVYFGMIDAQNLI